MRAAFIEIDDKAGAKQLLWRAKEFALSHRQLVGSYRALRRRLESRRENGLLAAGAVVETRYGLLLDPLKYREWLLQPRCAIAGKSARHKSHSNSDAARNEAA